MNEENKDGPVTTDSVYSIDSEKHLVPVRSRAAYFKRTKKRSLLMVALVFVMSALITCIVVLAVLYSRVSRARMCDNKNCVRIAASLKESMDTSIDPCDDFYGYVCGRWSKEHLSIESDNSWFSERSDRVTLRIMKLLRKNLTEDDVPWAVSQAKIFYDSCVDVESMDLLGLQPLVHLLEELDFTRMPPLISDQKGDFLLKSANVRRTLMMDIFFGVGIGPDPRNRSKNVIFLGPSNSDDPWPSYNTEVEKRIHKIKSQIEDMDDSNDFVSASKSYMHDVIQQLVTNGAEVNCSSFDEDSNQQIRDIKRVTEAIYNFQDNLYDIIEPARNQSKPDEDSEDEDYMLVDALQELTDQYVKEMNSSLEPRKLWRPYLEEFFKGEDDVDLSKVVLLVGNTQYMKDIAYLLDSTDEDLLETIVWYKVVELVVPHSSRNLRKLWKKYLEGLLAEDMNNPRTLYCAEATNKMMAIAVSWLFVDPNFHNSKGPKVIEMLENIRSSFASLVRDADWMDRGTKLATLRKSRKMNYVIGYPDWLFDEESINGYYEGIEMIEDTFLENLLNITRLMTMGERELLHETNHFNESFWAADPTDVNAVHSYVANHITIPAGILQFPFYDLGLEALNYGAIGTIIGHELTHGFDNSGRLYDEDGNVRQWWSNATITQYKSKTKCFVDHYNTYYVDEVDDYIDGELTLGENIADNGGLREAVLAYKKWKKKHRQEPALPGFAHFSHEQLLFISYAHLWCEATTIDSLRWQLHDPHCPASVRLRGVLRNSEEFSQTWKCPPGSGMNPQKKCKLW